MALQFQPPNIQVKSKEEALSEKLSPTIQSLPLMWMQYKLQRGELSLKEKALLMQQREMDSKYGTGGPGSVVAAGSVGAMPETPEQQLARLGSTGYQALHPAPTTIISPTGETLGTVQGKTAVLPQAKPSANLTPGQIATDKKFGQSYEEFAAGGGYASSQKNLEQLQGVIDELKTGKAKTGIVSGAKSYLPFTKARSSKESVEEVIQTSLRQILGAQFTEKEGRGVLSRAYNASQKPEENIKRLERLIKQLDAAAQAKEQAGQYFEENGTLKGYKGIHYSSADQLGTDDDSHPTNRIRVRSKQTGQEGTISEKNFDESKYERI